MSDKTEEEVEVVDEDEGDGDEEQEEVKPMSETNGIKIVINLKGDKINAGISKPNCDPIFRTGDMSLLPRIGDLVAEANTIWSTKPRYPRCESKLPSQEPAPARTTTPGRQTTTTAANKEQRALF